MLEVLMSISITNYIFTPAMVKVYPLDKKPLCFNLHYDKL